MAKNSNGPIYVGVDDGHYAVKVVTENGDEFTVPSRATQGKQAMLQSATEMSGGYYEPEEGGVCTVYDGLPRYDDTRFAGYPQSSLNRVLVHHALRVAGLAGKDVVIATGLPIADYYLSGTRNVKLIEAKKANLAKGVKCEQGPCARIVRNIVTTEAIAAHFDRLMDFNGQPTAAYEELQNASVGVIDIGGKTTDCAVILRGGQMVDPQRSGSSNIGILALNDSVEAALRQELGYDNVPTPMVESAIRSGRVRLFGKDTDVSTLVTSAKRKLLDEIMTVVRTKIGSGADLDSVQFVGGGSIVLRDLLQDMFPHAHFPERGEFANARGMLKIVKHMAGAGAP